ncbi:hypothetical protein D0N87_25720 [Pseudomonas sp. ATCC 13867]|nr:hypothetical protein D0N87_25720 [Pseudomonas sp. ATCC 13867]
MERADLPHAASARAQPQLSVPSTEDLQKAIAAGLDPTQSLAPPRRARVLPAAAPALPAAATAS